MTVLLKQCTTVADLRDALKLAEAEGKHVDEVRPAFVASLAALCEARLVTLYRALLFAVMDEEHLRKPGLRQRIGALEAAPSDPRIDRAQSIAALLEFLSPIGMYLD